jgi:hypothetical protein
VGVRLLGVTVGLVVAITGTAVLSAVTPGSSLRELGRTDRQEVLTGPVRSGTPEDGPCRVSTPHAAASPSSESDAEALSASCARAVPAVAAVWPRWAGAVDITVSPVALDPGIAAYVDGQAVEGGPTTGDRVVVAPGLPAVLSREGLDIVLRHELTHLAMRSTGTRPLPQWVSEGIAMHVAYAPLEGGDAQPTAELRRLRDLVDSGAWTISVPGEEAFQDPALRPDAYTAAWLGVEALVADVGLDLVVGGMRSAPGPADPRSESPVRRGGPASAMCAPPVATSLSDADRSRCYLGALGRDTDWLDEQWRTVLRQRTR